jgi:hypothetical protein
MTKGIIALAIAIFLCTSAQAQAGGMSEWPQTIIKTNLLNILFIPSAHLEQQLAKKMSVQLNFHRARVNFISLSQYLNTSADLRYYLFRPKLKNNTRALLGLYPSLGFQIHHDYQAVRYVGGTAIYGGATEFGPQAKVGFQYQSANSRFVADLNIGMAIMVGQFQKTDTYYPDNEGRLGICLGYRLH